MIFAASGKSEKPTIVVASRTRGGAIRSTLRKGESADGAARST
jgi:hypothetical protein